MQPAGGWRERVLGSTRGRIVTLLRAADRTVNELADAVGLTDNAVRTHLAALERDGLVVMRGVRRGGGKPAHVYGLTTEAEALFPRAYGLVLRTVVEAMRGTLPAGQVDALVAETGRRLGAGLPRPSGDLAERAEAAVGVLSALGGVAAWQAEEGGGKIPGLG